ncbi:hypothetical protein [Inquilinus limosus]|uniref:Uncharacterized protein n=1 Tax=Inquilinus limosus TaxID=171674 RepID=A0A211ZRK3_9PROT|nr:hypothetical protein [Inquilinus limosus]OWJ67824.1 hypothetical protein BWR60_07545 [Inquilinus limosus]
MPMTNEARTYLLRRALSNIDTRRMLRATKDHPSSQLFLSRLPDMVRNANDLVLNGYADQIEEIERKIARDENHVLSPHDVLFLCDLADINSVVFTEAPFIKMHIGDVLEIRMVTGWARPDWFDEGHAHAWEVDFWDKLERRRVGDVLFLERKDIAAMRGALIPHNVPLNIHRKDNDYKSIAAKPHQMSPERAKETQAARRKWIPRLAKIIDADKARELRETKHKRDAAE